MKLLYDLGIFLGGMVHLPKRLLKRKDIKQHLKEHLGLKLPSKKESEPLSILIHMVSIGETKAMIPIYNLLKKHHPDAAIYLSSITETGQQEAKKSLPGAKAYFYLPLDFSWNMKRLTQRIKPNLLILSESDFWYHLIKSVKISGGKVCVLNGKISKTSTKRFSKAPWFANQLFQPIDLFCVQTQEYKQRFTSLGIDPKKIQITPNLKFAIPFTPAKELDTWKKRFNLKPEDKVITVASTHEKEEELILSQILSIPNIKVLLVPRHPGRLPSLKKHASDKVILVEEMGILSICYQLSHAAIVGGSFIPKIGGHNIFEPIQAHIPVIFGPHMENQAHLTQTILEAKAGLQIPHTELKKTLTKILQDSSPYVESAKILAQEGRDAHLKTWDILENLLKTSSSLKINP